MKTIEWNRWVWQYVLPIAILALSVPLTYLIMEGLLGQEDPDLFWVLAIAPVIAFLIGFIVRPINTLVIPIVAVILYIGVAVVARGAGDAAEIVLPVVILLGAPTWFLIWAGKRVRPWFDEKVAARRHDELHPPTG